MPENTNLFSHSIFAQSPCRSGPPSLVVVYLVSLYSHRFSSSNLCASFVADLLCDNSVKGERYVYIPILTNSNQEMKSDLFTMLSRILPYWLTLIIVMTHPLRIM